LPRNEASTFLNILQTPSPIRYFINRTLQERRIEMRMTINGASVCLLGLVLAACATGSESLQPGDTSGGVPDLRGRRVLVLPVQIRDGASASVTIDEEIVYALSSRGEQVSWAFPSEVDRVLRRSPGVQANLYGLPVGIFLQVQVNRIGDPLYGEIRRLSTLVGAEFALIPVQLSYGADGRFSLAATILNPVTGRVTWFGIIQGGEGAADAPGSLASVTNAFALAILPVG